MDSKTSLMSFLCGTPVGTGIIVACDGRGTTSTQNGPPVIRANNERKIRRIDDSLFVAFSGNGGTAEEATLLLSDIIPMVCDRAKVDWAISVIQRLNLMRRNQDRCITAIIVGFPVSPYQPVQVQVPMVGPHVYSDIHIDGSGANYMGPFAAGLLGRPLMPYSTAWRYIADAMVYAISRDWPVSGGNVRILLILGDGSVRCWTGVPRFPMIRPGPANPYTWYEGVW